VIEQILSETLCLRFGALSIKAINEYICDVLAHQSGGAREPVRGLCSRLEV
jgi:hypothetical protein